MKAVLALLALSALGACSRAASADLPAWMQLKPGTQARLVSNDKLDPEHVSVYPSAVAAFAGPIGAGSRGRAFTEGLLVVIDEVQPHPALPIQAVHVRGEHGVQGWVTDDELVPVPPVGTMFEIPAPTTSSAPPLLYDDADDDEGVAFGSAAHVQYQGFTADPGNPEYSVDVQDGTLAGRKGYVLYDELQSPLTHGFRLVPPNI